MLWLNFIWEIACYKPITARQATKPGINIDIDHSIRGETSEKFLSQCRYRARGNDRLSAAPRPYAYRTIGWSNKF